MEPSLLIASLISFGLIVFVIVGGVPAFRHRIHRKAKVSIIGCLLMAIIICLGYRAYFGRMVSLMQNDEPTIH